MHPLNISANQVRLAGLLYLAIIALGLSGELFLRGTLIVPGDPTATAAAVLADPGRMRLAVAADLVMALCDAALAVLLYWLFVRTAPLLATLATTFRLLQTAVIAANLIALNASLGLLEDPHLAVGLGAEPVAALAANGFARHAAGYDIGLAFFGINAMLLGTIMLRSGPGPRPLGALMVAAGAVYLTGTALRVLAPGMVDTFAPVYLVALVAELGFALWLLAGPGRVSRPGLALA